MKIFGYITYYWQCPSYQVLHDLLFTTGKDENGNPIDVPIIDNLGIIEGDSNYGQKGVFYTCARSEKMIMMTPQGCQLAEPYVVFYLLGAWA